MTFYNETSELPNGSYVKMGSYVSVIIELTNNIEGSKHLSVLLSKHFFVLNQTKSILVCDICKICRSKMNILLFVCSTRDDGRERAFV